MDGLAILRDDDGVFDVGVNRAMGSKNWLRTMSKNETMCVFCLLSVGE